MYRESVVNSSESFILRDYYYSVSLSVPSPQYLRSPPQFRSPSRSAGTSELSLYRTQTFSSDFSAFFSSARPGHWSSGRMKISSSSRWVGMDWGSPWDQVRPPVCSAAGYLWILSVCPGWRRRPNLSHWGWSRYSTWNLPWRDRQ